jgi:trans-2,3-dihydro-3-hydroxyanthranilate isomerase
MKRRFATLDVFTDRPFTGNSLAVVLGAEGIDTASMQAIAREFNHPETVFVLPPKDPANRALLRIFTPARELPFAGHPTVGTAVFLGGMDGGTAERQMLLEEGIGPVHCRVELISREHGRARFSLPHLPAEAGTAPPDATIAAALGLPIRDLGIGPMRPSVWSAGVPIVFVPVAGLSAVRDCRPDSAALTAAFGCVPVYVFCTESVESGHSFHARMFAPALGVPEDPATGAAAAAFAGLLAASGTLAVDDHAIVIEQGYEMGRPSLIRLGLALKAGSLVSAAVGGDAVLVTEGMIEA